MKRPKHSEASNRIGPEDFVFCKDDGSPLNRDVLRRDVLYSALERLRLPRLSRSAGFHTFRHSAASLINHQTGTLKLAQKLLGHSKISTTADVYTHTSDESEREASVILERAIFGDLFPNVPNLGTGTSAWVGNTNGQSVQMQ
jgi:integrase